MRERRVDHVAVGNDDIGRPGGFQLRRHQLRQVALVGERLRNLLGPIGVGKDDGHQEAFSQQPSSNRRCRS